jgi:amino acid permease
MEYNHNFEQEIKRPLLLHRLSSLSDEYRPSKDKNILENKLEEWKAVYFQPITKGSLRASIFCLLCVTLGSSLLSMPYTMKACGVILSLIIFIICAILTGWTLNLIVKTAQKEDCYDYEKLVSIYYNKNLTILTGIMCLMNILGSMAAWNKFIFNITSDLSTYFSIDDFFIDTEYTKLLLSFLIVIFVQLPVCTLNKISNFYILSSFGSLFVIYIVIVSIFEFPFYFRRNFAWEKINYFDFNFNFIQIFCIFFFAFGNHSTIMNAMGELRDKRKVTKLAKYTQGVEYVLYLITIVVGYFSTFDDTQEIYINREGQSIFMVVGKIIFILVMICNIGLYYYMVKPFLEHLFYYQDMVVGGVR